MQLDGFLNLTEYLNHICQVFGISITMKDVAGFLPLYDKKRQSRFDNLLIHDNAYCIYVKDNNSACTNCGAMKSRIVNKCMREKRIFFGVCYAGVGEYIVPVISFEGKLIAFITVGCFHMGKTGEYLVGRICRKANMREAEALKYYSGLLDRKSVRLQQVSHLFEIVSDLLRHIYERRQNVRVQLDEGRRKSNEELLLDKITGVIERFYSRQLNVSQISKLCACSESHINHLFKKKTGMTIKTGINKLRIKEAKRLLAITQKSITEIALEVGFSEPNYFSKVFTEITEMSPTDYRKMYL